MIPREAALLLVALAGCSETEQDFVDLLIALARSFDRRPLCDRASWSPADAGAN